MDSSRPSYVAMLDILGFRNLVETTEIDVAGQLLQDLQYEADETHVKSIQFSDSILLYTEGIDSTHLRAIVEATARLMGHFAAYLIGLRGGIARGEFWHGGGVFLGKAMIRAYELEQSQDWLGGIVDPEISQNANAATSEMLTALEQEKLLVRYPAPIKGGPVGTLLCVGWPVYYPERGPVDLAPATAPWALLRKQSNTNEFLVWHRSHSQ